MSSRSEKKLTYHVIRAGNNTEPISRALDAKGWEAVDRDEAKASDYWFVNSTWLLLPDSPLFARVESLSVVRSGQIHESPVG